MGTILEFQRKSDRPERPGRSGEPCEVVFFTGVRYERTTPAESRRAEAGQNRAAEAQATLTN